MQPHVFSYDCNPTPQHTRIRSRNIDLEFDITAPTKSVHNRSPDRLDLIKQTRKWKTCTRTSDLFLKPRRKPRIRICISSLPLSDVLAGVFYCSIFFLMKCRITISFLCCLNPFFVLLRDLNCPQVIGSLNIKLGERDVERLTLSRRSYGCDSIMTVRCRDSCPRCSLRLVHVKFREAVLGLVAVSIKKKNSHV